MQILKDLIEHLELVLPVDLTIKTRKGKDCDAFYLPIHSQRTGKLKGHRIVIYTVDTGRTFEALLAHELIHAAQEENRKLEIHGEYFVELARELEDLYSLDDIYDPEIDTD